MILSADILQTIRKLGGSMKTTVKGQGKQIKVETGRQKPCKERYIVRAERIEILCENGKIVSVLEDLYEQKFR